MESGLMAKHIQEIDTLRAFAIIFIIFAHIDSYTTFIFFDTWDNVFAFIGLSLFFFISGFLLPHTNKISSKKDIIIFLKKKALSIYPIYWSSMIISYFMIYVLNINILYLEPVNTTTLKLLLNIFGLQGLMSEKLSLGIWWFVGTILLYYFIYIIIAYHSNNNRDIMLKSFIIISFLLLIRYKFGMVHSETLKYYFAFVLGILISEVKEIGHLKDILVYYFISFIIIFIDKNTIDVYSSNIFKYLIMFAPVIACIAFYKIKMIRSTNYKSNKIFSNIAFGSYAIYLFHLQIFTIFEIILDFIFGKGILETTSVNFIMLFIGIPIVLITGYYLQKISLNFAQFLRKTKPGVYQKI